MDYVNDPARDAHRTFAGFAFQVNSTILYWLNLSPGQHLELESGEDIDIVRSDLTQPREDYVRLLTQLKQLSNGSLTLRNRDALESVVNFCWHLDQNPDWKLRFRFITTLEIGKEREGWSFSPSAIRTWESIRRSENSEEQRIAGLDALLNFLRSYASIEQFSPERRAGFERMLAGQTPYTFADIVNTFEWATGSDDYVGIKGMVLSRIREILPNSTDEETQEKFIQLFAFVFETLCHPGPKRLHADTLRGKMSSITVSGAYLAATATFASRLDALEARVSHLEQRVDQHDENLHRHDEQLQSHTEAIQNLEAAQDGALKTFYSADEFFPTEHRGAVLYDLDQQFRGRRVERETLDRFLGDDKARIAVVEGSGGIGKTKLLRDWSASHTDWSICWVGPLVSVWHTGTPNEIPTGNVLILIDDGHKYDDLERLTTLVADWRGLNQPKLVISARRSDNNNLRQSLSRIDDSAITRLPVLVPLGHEDVLALAEEVLGPDAIQHAQRLAEVSADNPFITVVGGRLIAQGKAEPDLLNNAEEFTRRVFDRLASQYQGNLPSSRYTKAEFMQFVAALQPVKEDDPFIEKAANFLQIRASEVRRGFTSLQQNGVLKRARKGSSVIPDLLADHLLEQASFEGDGRPTEFADEVFEAFEDTHLATLLKNLTLLYRRIGQRDHQTRLLNKIWERLSNRFRQQNAHERIKTLRALEGVAVYLPEHVHVLIKIAMDEPAHAFTFYNIHRYTQHDVVKLLPPFLGVTILYEPTGQNAFDRLWQLTQYETEDVRRYAQKALEGAIGYKVGKNLLFNAHVLSIVERSAADPGAYHGSFTPLDLLDEIMVREIDHTEWDGHSFRNSVHTIIPEAVRSLRQRVFEVIQRCLDSDCPRVAFRAVRSLSKIVSVFIPMRRNEASDEEIVWHEKERNHALDTVQRRVDHGHLALPVVWKIRKILQTAAEEERQSQSIRERARTTLSILPHPDLFRAFHALCSDPWRYSAEANGYSRREAEESSGATELRGLYPVPADQVRIIESLISQARDARVDPASVDSFVSYLCREREFLSAFSEHLLAQPNSVLQQVAGIAIRAWRTRDMAEYLRFGLGFINDGTDFTRHSVAQVIRIHPSLDDITAEDVALLVALAERPEPWIHRAIFQSLAILCRSQQFSVIAQELIRNVDIGRNRVLADEYCQIVGGGPYQVRASSLCLETLRAMVSKLVPVPELDRHHFGSFVSDISGIIPREIVDLMRARLEFAQTYVADDNQPLHKPVPSPQNWSSLSAVRRSPHYAEALRRIFDLGLRFPDQTPYLDELFWRFGTLDETTFAVLDEGLHSEDMDRYRRALSVLCHAPKNVAFSRPLFALHLLTVSELRGAEWGNTAMDILVSNCISVGGFQAVGPNMPPIGAGIAERARSLMEVCPPNSPLHRLYAQLASIQPMPVPDFAAELEASEDE